MAPRSSPRPPLVALKDVRLQDGPRPLFDGVDLALEPRTRSCLVGRNGAGKSTLMKVVMGLIEPDSGTRSMQAGVRFAYVPQEPLIAGDTLLDYATSGEAEPWTAEAWLTTFGMDPQKSTKGLSGGEIRRAALAKAFAEEPDLLLLDEPTNHMDILAIELLEKEIIDARCATLIVSHDRAFLNRVTQSCHWLEGRRVRTLNKGFDAFDEWAAKTMEEEALAFQKLTKTIERETATFYSSITARRSRNEGRARSLDALRAERAEQAQDRPREMYMGVDSGGTSGKLVADLKGVTKSFGDRVVIKPFTSRIVRGARLAIVGPNGAGKTTLVKIMLGELAPTEGTVKLGASLETVYLDQSRDGLRSDMTLWDVLTPGGGDSIIVRGISKHVAAYAKDFLFTDAQLRQPISTLSGGERNRLLLALALAKPANMLVLDEPTNDLDMDTLDKLQELLEQYDGTLILVSHDRDFVDRLATSTIGMNGRGDIVETPGGWTDFIGQNPGFLSPSPSPSWGGTVSRQASQGGEVQPQSQATSFSDSPTPTASAVAPPHKGEGEVRAKPGKMSFKDTHRLKELDALIHELPDTIKAHQSRLDDVNFYSRDPAGFASTMKALEAAQSKLAAAEEEWLELEAKREALAG
ncbi:ABC-F family ATP-binding cassette domain-containing protein [Brevundimonas sp.]|uniref:ABC-F family ATP-binding cassette domain-containing protein n=1 Tax=Brevundimonas sp. TaxID=1871086 RepID=UPI002ABCDBFF|nr:ABC-F family ATP-binding cassette domain-containing protein [Brevundimonas sp.]MDZ4363239.1 ABC-F family ATP-binding cassette domain-containing protein [Brevundimonas sp.]